MKSQFFKTSATVGLSLAAAMSFTACGDDSTTSAGSNSGSMSSSKVEDYEDLPDCSKDNEKDIITVTDEDIDYICSDKEWIEVVTNPPKSCDEGDDPVYSKKDKKFYVCEEGKFVVKGNTANPESSSGKTDDDTAPDTEEPIETDQPTTPDTPDQPTTPDTPDQPTTPDTPDQPTTPDTPDQPTTPDTPVANSSSSQTPSTQSSSSTVAPVVTGTDILNGKGEFTKNGKIYTTSTDVLDVFKAYRWDAAGVENGNINFIKNDDGQVVLEFYPTKNNANIYDLQLEKDINIKAGYSYQIFIQGYDYGVHRSLHVGIQSLKGASGTSYENYISNDGSYWYTGENTWKSGKALVCQDKIAQFYVNAGGQKGEGVAIQSLKIIETPMPADICDENLTGTDLLAGKGMFTENDKIITTTTDKLDVFMAYRWDALGNENGNISFIRNDDGQVVLEFYPTKDNANIHDLQLEKDINIKAGYAYQIALSGYDYGVHRNLHVGIQSLFDENNPTSYENYISDDGSYWNTGSGAWTSGKALVCQDKKAQFYVNAGGKKGEGVALNYVKIIEKKMPAGICD